MCKKIILMLAPLMFVACTTCIEEDITIRVKKDMMSNGRKIEAHVLIENDVK